MKKHIPNSITCLNLFSGCVGVVFAFSGQLELAAYCVVLSGVFDFFDGLAARALNVQSRIGKELDSLADVISFGLLPGVVFYKLLGIAFSTSDYVPYIGFAVTVFSALRLAKFNVDESQTTDFVGLNTPTNAFFVASLPFLADAFPTVIHHPAFLLGTTVATSLLLVSNIRLFSLKMDGLSWQKNGWKFAFLILSAILVVCLGFKAVPAVLVLYFLFSYIHFGHNKRIAGR